MCATCVADSTTGPASRPTASVSSSRNQADVQLVSGLVSKDFPAQYHHILGQEVGLREEQVIKLKESLNIWDRNNLGVADKNSIIKSLGNQVSKGQPVDRVCSGKAQKIHLSGM